MCMIRSPKIPTPVERQPIQTPKDPMGQGRLNPRRRRGFWASVMTGPQGDLSPLQTTSTDRLNTLYPNDRKTTLGGS